MATSAAPSSAAPDTRIMQDAFANAALELEIPEEEFAQMLGTSIPAPKCITAIAPAVSPALLPTKLAIRIHLEHREC